MEAPSGEIAFLDEIVFCGVDRIAPLWHYRVTLLVISRYGPCACDVMGRPRMALNFKVGDRAVYPAQGVAEITAIEKKEIFGNQETFYVLQVLDSAKKIMIPLTKVESVGLRPVITKRQADEVYVVLKERDVKLDQTTWNRRYRRYLEKIKTGSIQDVAEVLRDLYILKEDKPLSFGERKMLDTARQLLVQELSVARKVKEQKILDSLIEIFGDDDPHLDNDFDI
jgi:CarD family transcriptional regulator